MKKHEIKLEFDEKYVLNQVGKHVRDGLSTALLLGENLFIACDERNSLERLTRTGNHTFGQHKHFNLHEFLELPEEDTEIDIEGTGYQDHYLWLVGSHSLARKKPKKKNNAEEQIARLAKIKQEANRYLLARIPLVKNPETGQFELYKECPHPEIEHLTLKASQLMNTGPDNKIMTMLSGDIHLKAFLKIPGKDNGFDIEGLALGGDKLFIGLRGPVLRGWAMILEVETEDAKSGYFKFKAVGEKGALYKKHFLHLEGMGIRELRILKDDMYILAGPTMDLDGTISVYRWKNAVNQTAEAIMHRKELERLFDVPHGHGQTFGKDKAEGMTFFDEQNLLIVFDSPADERKPDDNSVLADVFRL